MSSLRIPVRAAVSALGATASSSSSTLAASTSAGVRRIQRTQADLWIRRTFATVDDETPSPPPVIGNRKEVQEAANETDQSIDAEEAKEAVHAEVAAAVTEATTEALQSATTTSAPSSSNPIYASVIISRPPTLLREPTKLEQSIFAYNSKLLSALAQPFPRDFYFKKGSTAEQRFDDAETRRLTSLQEGKTDPLSFMPNRATEDGQVSSKGSAVGTANAEKSPDADLYAILPRTTEADKKNDTTSLNRKLDRTLYLLTKTQKKDSKDEAEWVFPSQHVVRSGQAKENLHQAARRAVESQLGDEIDVWLVSNLPIGVTQPKSGSDPKTYYMQAHVLSGNVSAEDQTEYAWLTREEIEAELTQPKSGKGTPNYWEQVRDFLRA
ncbi:hypothetical protein OC846_000626 [Tilletia horrida]|uniref:Large ribosomal subunit protein mL46 n=1 Tax=Tilletia horrida TaxID=155126 RepID=A0AAN6JWS7_9BASI|nr:hypothetical protein OC846_000626 [Tilletia horrida]